MRINAGISNREIALAACLFFSGAVSFPSAGQTKGESGMDQLRIQEAKQYTLLSRLQKSEDASGRPFHVQFYRLNIRLVEPGLTGEVTIIGRILRDGVTSILLDLSQGMTADSVLLNGQNVTFSHTSDLLSATLPGILNTGATFTETVYYHGNPASTGFGSFADSVLGGGVHWIWTLSEPYGARDWWPCINAPSAKADSVDIWITCDSAYTAVSQGKLIAIRSNGDGTTTYQWAHRYPITAYLISVTLTNFDHFSFWYKYSPADSMEIVNFVTPDLPSKFPAYLSNLAKTPQMLAIFSGLFGPYPFIREKYGHAEFGWGGAMEHQTLTSVGTYAFTETVIAHELSHQWFGDMITCRTWADLWLNEGFATYCEALYQEAAYGRDAYWGKINGDFAGAKTATASLYLTDTSSVHALFAGNLVYSKGGAVLHMLRHVLGDSIFFAAMRAYANDPGLRYNTATTADFQSVCEQVSGNNLSYFFNEWLYGQRYPKYYYSLSVAPSGLTYQATVRIQQTTGTTNPAYFTMPLDLRFAGAGFDSTTTVWNNSGDQTFTFAFPVRPDSLFIDPGNWILKDTQEVSTNVDVQDLLPRRTELEQNFPNPFNPSTIIRYDLTSAASVSVKIYNVLGQELETLVDAEKTPGRYEVTWNAASLPSGIYFCRLQARPTDIPQSTTFVQTKKMLLMK